MGYRSSVAYLIAGKTADIQAFLITTRLTRPDLAGALREVTVGMLAGLTPDSYIGFQDDDIKWYSGYADVRWHEELWTLAEATGLFDGRFCRIGDEINDTEIMEFGNGALDLYEYVNVDRSLGVWFGTDEDDDMRATWKEDPTWRAMPLPARKTAAPAKKKTRLKKPNRSRPNSRLTSWTIAPRSVLVKHGVRLILPKSGGTPRMRTRSV